MILFKSLHIILAVLLLAKCPTTLCGISTANGGAPVGNLNSMPGAPIPPIICNFSDYVNHESVTSWEFQLDIPPDKCQWTTRDELLTTVENALLGLSENATMRFDFDKGSLRTSVYDQFSTALTTLDGRPLFPAKHPQRNFTWNGPAFIRSANNVLIEPN